MCFVCFVCSRVYFVFKLHNINIFGEYPQSETLYFILFNGTYSKALHRNEFGSLYIGCYASSVFFFLHHYRPVSSSSISPSPLDWKYYNVCYEKLYLILHNLYYTLYFFFLLRYSANREIFSPFICVSYRNCVMCIGHMRVLYNNKNSTLILFIRVLCVTLSALPAVCNKNVCTRSHVYSKKYKVILSE